MIRIPTAVLFAFALVTAPMATQAGDAAALRVLGFSPDGSVFAFEQFTMLYEDDAAFSEYVFIDTRTDRYLPNTPVRVLVRGDEGLDEKKARADAVRRATPLIAQHRVSEAGTHIQGAPSMDLDDIGIYQADPKPLARTLSFALPDGRKTELAIAERALGKAVCKGAGGGRVPGPVAVQGFRLTLNVDGRAPATLQDDKTLPQSRRCVSGYGIAGAYLHSAPGGAATLAVMIELVDNDGYHAGPNRRFMAVTTRLPAK